MRHARFYLTLAFFFPVSFADAQVDSIKSYYSTRIEGNPPRIDGYLDDEVWQQVEWAGGDFRQIQPDKGKPATVQTRFAILYDEKNLYIAFRNYDPEPDKIVRRMSRRDGFDGDWVEINIDSYNDKRTAFSFTSSVSGVKGDEYISDNGDIWDANWDPIWYLKTSINDEGWIAELRIPLSQLRFANQPELTWGIQVTRRLFRNQERSVWQYIPPDAAGWVHLFGELRGIKGIKPQKQLEVQPYTVGKVETFQKEEGDPFLTGQRSGVALGLDAKIGITSDITLDLTVNPDFGQVEADPSQVNLTAFELFFEERRPFFIEGNNTLNFPLALASSSNLFYSRRIGRPPQGYPVSDPAGDDGINEYINADTRTTILGAAKLTGKNKKGFSWAVLASLTAAEYATIDSLGHRRSQIIEPLTGYYVARAQQDINKGNTVVGAMLTGVNRKIEDPSLHWLHDAAYSGGADLLHHWRDRTWYLSMRGAFSHVRGSATSISSTQLSAERFFQRPDNHYTEFDGDRTSLTGTGGQVVFGKKSGSLVSDLGFYWRSPSLELNDIGFMPQTDLVSQWFWMQYRILEPKRITRSQRFNINQWRDHDFGMKTLSSGYNVNTHFEFKNFWQVGGGFTYIARSASNADLRGGPTIRYPSSLNYWMYVSTDTRKKLQFMVEAEHTFGFEDYLRNTNLSLQLVYRPMNALNISMSPSLTFNENTFQYVATSQGADGDDRYIVGRIDQTVARMVLRATYMLTPNLSLEYYGQPFGTFGHYDGFKRISDGSSKVYAERFVDISPFTLVNGNGYSVDEDGDGITEYGFSRPDFNFAQFRSNMVLRWEYIPGSTLFLVWTKERNGGFYDSGAHGVERYAFDFPKKGHNIFLVKFTYRFVF